MVTVPEATDKIIRRSRYLSEALSKDIINISSLARYIKPEIETMLLKKVSISSINMALKRQRGNIAPDTPYRKIFNVLPEIIVKTNLGLLLSTQILEKNINYYYSTSTESTEVLLGKKEELSKLKTDQTQLVYPVSAISIPVPSEAKGTPGIYYFFIKSLAWERINILHFFTSPEELCIVIDEVNLQRSLEVIRGLFRDQLMDSTV